MPAASRMVFELLRTASREAFQVAISFATRPPVSNMVKPAMARSFHDQNKRGRDDQCRPNSNQTVSSTGVWDYSEVPPCYIN
ncbi:hypothetical protein DAI22_07g270900 [Oryza sativa Japonica Group]|nr:hypothetical protein DAI22_07g270900 [Oryza sativa Japonica Group]